LTVGLVIRKGFKGKRLKMVFKAYSQGEGEQGLNRLEFDKQSCDYSRDLKDYFIIFEVTLLF
jgi:hypothetical protein